MPQPTPEALEAAVKALYRIRAVERPADEEGLREVWHQCALGADLLTCVDAQGHVVRQELTLLEDFFRWTSRDGMATGSVSAPERSRAGAGQPAPGSEDLPRARPPRDAGAQGLPGSRPVHPEHQPAAEHGGGGAAELRRGDGHEVAVAGPPDPDAAGGGRAGARGGGQVEAARRRRGASGRGGAPGAAAAVALRAARGWRSSRRRARARPLRGRAKGPTGSR